MDKIGYDRDIYDRAEETVKRFENEVKREKSEGYEYDLLFNTCVRMEEARRFLQEIHNEGRDEAEELNRQHEELIAAVVSATEKLKTFENEKLEMHQKKDNPSNSPEV